MFFYGGKLLTLFIICCYNQLAYAIMGNPSFPAQFIEEAITLRT
jgi:hypothetical protein